MFLLCSSHNLVMDRTRMNKSFGQNFSLAGADGDDYNPYLNETGAFHGRNIALLQKDAIGF